MGGREDGGKGTLDKHKKIDDSEGMCGSESDYDSCWGRICRSERGNVLRDVLRGLLVLIALAIVITVVFLLCFFLLNDIEQKEEELVDTLIKDFSTGNRIDTELEFSIRDENKVKSDYPYDIDSRSEFKKNKESLSERTRPPKPISKEEETVHQIDGPKSNFNSEDDIFLSFTNPGAAHDSPTDSEIANTEGSFVGAFAPKSDEADMQFDVITEFTQTESDGQCVPLRLPLCSGSMPWTITKFPNFVNNTNEKELQESATYFQSVIVGSRCSTRATEYTCSILEPACGPDGVPLPPCRTFCEDILASCSDFLIPGNIHNTAFDCQHYPESADPNVCVDISRTSSSSSVNEPHDNVEGLPVNSNTEEDLAPVLNENPEVSEVVPETDIKTDDSSFANVEESPPEEIAPTDAPVFICDHSKFLCDDGSDCLNDESVCDGVKDCLDNSDELNCTQPECSIDDFSCATTKYCIPKTWVCDGADDCRDNSDEINCQETLNSDNDQDKLLAEASDITPGQLSIIEENKDSAGGGAFSNVFRTNENSDSILPINENEFGFAAKVPQYDEDGVGLNAQSEVDNIENQNGELTGQEQPEESLAGPSENEFGHIRPGLRRRRPVRPDLLRFHPRRRQSTQNSSSSEDATSVIETEPTEKTPTSRTRLTIPNFPRRTRNGSQRITSRRPLNGIRDRFQTIRTSKETEIEGETEIETVKGDEVPTEVEDQIPQESVDEMEKESHLLRGNRRRGQVPNTENEPLRNRNELSPVRRVQTRRPVSIVRRRPTADSFDIPESTAEHVELLKETPKTELEDVVDETAVAQPITIPEQIIPHPNFDQILLGEQDPNFQSNFQSSEHLNSFSEDPAVYNYDSVSENDQSNPSIQEYDQQYDNVETPTNNDESHYPPTVQETPDQNPNLHFQQYDASNQQDENYIRYDNPHVQYQPAEPTAIKPNVHYNTQYNPQQIHSTVRNSQPQHHIRNYNPNQNGQQTHDSSQNYYNRVSQTSDYYEAPKYSQQTHPHLPSYEDNIFHYANPVYPYRTSQGYREDYRQSR